MKISKKFDSWVAAGPFTPLDLGVYRIVYATATLCVVPGLRWLAEYPDSMYSAPFGPFQLLSGIPDFSFLIVLELLRTLALVLLALGAFTKWSGLAAGVLLLLTYGLSYTLGKIDHTILLVITPLILSFAHWGDRLSVDAVVCGRNPRATPQWPLRYLALAIGLSFFVAAAMKLGTGWLDPSSQAVRGYAVQYFLSQGRSAWFAGWASGFNVRSVWEVLDWFTVVFEFALLAAVPWWRAFRVTLAFAALFHLGVFLIMNITFTHNLIPYGAFISWGALAAALRAQNGSLRMGSIVTRSHAALTFVSVAVAVGLTAVFWLVSTNTVVLAEAVNLLMLFGGGAIAVWYLIKQVLDILSARRRVVSG